MPNGFHGSKEAWRQLIAPLADADVLLVRFAESHGMELARNPRGWPGRSLSWGADVNRKFEFWLADEKTLTFSAGATAWKDGVEGRAWRHEALREEVSWSTLREDLAALLEEGVRLADSWGEVDLVLVGRSGS